MMKPACQAQSLHPASAPSPSPTSQGTSLAESFLGWDVGSGTCRRRPTVLASRSCPGLSGTSRVGDAGPATVVDSLACRNPQTRAARPFFRQPGPPVTAGGGAGSHQHSRGGRSRVSTIPPASRPSRDSGFLAVGQRQTCRRPSDPARHPSDPGARGRAAGEVG